MYNQLMTKHVIHISDAEAASDFASLLDRVRKGAEIVIEHDARPVGVMRPADLMSGCYRNLSAWPESTARQPHSTEPSPATWKRSLTATVNR